MRTGVENASYSVFRSGWRVTGIDEEVAAICWRDRWQDVSDCVPELGDGSRSDFLQAGFEF